MLILHINQFVVILDLCQMPLNNNHLFKLVTLTGNEHSNFGNQTADNKEKAAYCKIDKSNICKLTNVPKTVKACI